MISTHILDTSSGHPASQLQVSLEIRKEKDWEVLHEVKTDKDGRAQFDIDKTAGNYRLIFNVEEYFSRTQTETFYLRVPVVFQIKDTNRKYHVPLLLNPFGYSTYRGS